MMRPTTSVEPPGGNGTIRLIGRDGHVCAPAPMPNASSATAATSSRFIGPFFRLRMSCSENRFPLFRDMRLLTLDVRRLDDRPPLVDLHLVEGGEPFRRLLLGGGDVEPEL